MEKKFTVADILSTSANNNVMCHLYDEVHRVNENATEAEISDDDCTYDWATATVNYWHVTDEGNLEFNAELQNFDTERQKYLVLTEDLSLIRDALQQNIRDLKSTDGPWSEDIRNELKRLRKTKIYITHLLNAVNMAANKKAVITSTGWLNMIAVCEPIRSTDASLIKILVSDIMDIYTTEALPAIYNLNYTGCVQEVGE